MIDPINKSGAEYAHAQGVYFYRIYGSTYTYPIEILTDLETDQQPEWAVWWKTKAEHGTSIRAESGGSGTEDER